MEVVNKKGLHVNVFWLTISGIVLLFLSVLTYFYVLKGVYGNFNFFGDLSSLPGFSEYFKDDGPKVGILYSGYTENLLADGSTWLADNVTQWKRQLDNLKITYDVLQDSDLERGRHTKYKLLILPGSKSLSDREVSNIKKFIYDGGSVLATSGTASYSNNAKWRGWEFFSEVFGMKFVKEVPRDEPYKILTIRGGYPVTAGVPAGFPMKIATWDLPIKMEVLEPRTNQVSFWFNYRVEQGLVMEGLKKSAGISYGTYGKGRFIWWGFEISAMIGFQEDYIIFDRFVTNCVNWLLYRPISFIKDWPGDYQAAAIVTPILSDQPENIENILPILSAKKIKPIFFMEPLLAETKPDLVKKLAGFGLLGAIVDIGYLNSVNDTVNKLFSYEAQFEKIKSARDKIKAISKADVVGLSTAFGFYDNRTIKAMVDNGFYMLYSDSVSDRSVPKTVLMKEGSVIAVGKTARDDYEVIRDNNLVNPEFQYYTYEEDVQRVLFEGGMMVIKLHTDLQCLPENAGVLNELLNKIEKENIWITDAKHLYDWWSSRNKVEMRVEVRSDNRVAVTVSNPSNDIVKDFTISIDLQRKAQNIKVSSEIIGTKIPEYKYNPATKMIYLSVKNLDSGESRIYYIDYDFLAS